MKRGFWVPVIFVAAGLSGCGKEISKEFLDQSNGKLFERGEHTPYTGTVINDKPFFYLYLPAMSGAKISCISKVVDGVYDGSFSCKDENTGKTVIEAHAKNGKLDGEFNAYDYKTGKDLLSGNFKDGVLDGEEIIYQNAEKICETQYKKGKMEGRHVCWGAAETYNSQTLSYTYSRLNALDSGEKTADSTYENGEIKDGFVTGFTQDYKGGVYISRFEFKDGKKNGNQTIYRVPNKDATEKMLLAEGEYVKGSKSGKFTWYASDGKSVCSEKEYEDGAPVSGFINHLYADGTLSSKVSLAVMAHYFVKNGQEIIVTPKKCDDSKDGEICKKEVTQWDNGVALKSSLTEYRDDFKTIAYVANRELIKESVGSETKRLISYVTMTDGPCDWRTGAVPTAGKYQFPAYQEDVVQMKYDMYDSSYVHYVDNKPTTEEVCPYGVNLSSGNCASRKVGIDNNVSDGNQSAQIQGSDMALLNDKGASSVEDKTNEPPQSQPTESVSLKSNPTVESRKVVLSGPSFDCSKAGNDIEKLICSDAYIGNLDGILSQNYKALFGDKYGFDEAGKIMTKKEQKAWVEKRNSCTTDRCIIEAYKSRIDEICEIPVASGVNDCQSWMSLGESKR